MGGYWGKIKKERKEKIGYRCVYIPLERKEQKEGRGRIH